MSPARARGCCSLMRRDHSKNVATAESWQVEHRCYCFACRPLQVRPLPDPLRLAPKNLTARICALAALAASKAAAPA